MQAEIQTKVKIPVSEIKKILAEKFCLYHDFELEIFEDSVVESDSVNKENNKWIDVPADWKNTFCQTVFEGSECIDIVFRHGRQKDEVFTSEYIFAWRQDGHACDIIKYRLSRKN